MAETILSPGVFLREKDMSTVNPVPSEYGAAIVGPTTKGPVEVPTLVTSYSEYLSIFGGVVKSGSYNYSYLNQISAKNYFSQGGKSLLVTRVVDDAFTSATAAISNTEDTPVEAFELATISEGTIMNSAGTETATGALDNGTSDNLRWEITSVNTGSGTFNLVVRRGDDNTNDKIILEQFNNLSLDPSSPDYIESRIGNTTYAIVTGDGDAYLKATGTYPNMSKYIRVASVTTPAPGYLDNEGNVTTDAPKKLPIASSGSFGGATGDLFDAIIPANFYENIDGTDIQGVGSGSYDDVLALLSNKEEYKFNIITAPGLVASLHATTVSKLTAIAEGREDCIAIIDVAKFGSTTTETKTAAAAFDSSYSSTYWPWLQIFDSETGKIVWVPASTVMPGVYAYSDSTSEPWFAPAGLTRGGLGNVVGAERKLTRSLRNELQSSNVNPIANFPGEGFVVYGNKTLKKKKSATDRVNVRRLLIELKSYIGQVAERFVFEQNSIATRNEFKSQITPYLESVQQRQGLYSFKVVMDDTNNTPDVIDRNELVGQIVVQPTRSIEYIILDFSVTNTGVEF